jgi:hypothetical protein
MADGHLCEECGKRLATAGGLEIHVEMVHASPAPAPEAAFAAASPARPAPAVKSTPADSTVERPDPTFALAVVLVVLLFLGSVAALVHPPHPAKIVGTVTTEQVHAR